MDMFRKIHAQDSHAKLFLNEYGIVVNANKAVVSFSFIIYVLFLNRNNYCKGVEESVRAYLRIARSHDIPFLAKYTT